MSEQHLFKFQTENDYKTAKRNHLLVPNVSKIVENGNIYITPKFATKETAEAGDIIVYHIEADGEKTIKYMKPEAFDPNDDYWNADSIVVVPFSHTDDGTVRAMGKRFAGTETPSKGSDGEEIFYGTNHYRSGLRALGFLTFADYQNQMITDTHGLIYDDTAVNIASDRTTRNINPYDNETAYISDNAPFLPSPYLNNGGKSPAYHSINAFEEYSTNILKKLDGDTETHLTLKNMGVNFTDYMSETLVNQESIDGHKLCPAISASMRYTSVLKPCTFDENNTIDENIATMPWYLPSIGEVGYLAARFDKIMYAFNKINKNSIQIDPVTILTSSESHDETTEMVAVYDWKLQTFQFVSTNNLKGYVIPFVKF